MSQDHEKSRTATREEQILESWRKNKIFEKSLEKPSPKGEFVFYEGPPTANGKPGIHHLEARAFKDLIPRFKTMQGYHVRRKGGWDTHGLPVELEVEKRLGLKTKKDIEKYGVAEFNEECKKSVWKYLEEWDLFTERIGYWVDQENPYVTYKNNYIESVWNILQQVDKKKLLYKDYKVVPWCPRCGTALSSHELAQGYKDVSDTSVYIKFKSVDRDEYFLAWTTTPWTLPGNVALAIKKDVLYVKADVGGDILWFAKDLLNKVAPEGKVLEEVMGEALIGKEYEPLFEYLKDSIPDSEKSAMSNAFKIYDADFVTTEDGTGIVHTAVMYGQEDFELGVRVGLPKHHLVDEEGKFTDDVKKYAGTFVKDADEQIIEDLKKKKLLFSTEQITHTYPFCWRCTTPLIYYARDSWYIRMSKLRKKLIKENQHIHWEPEHIKDGRFGEWLRGLKDWAISRSRYWGTPLPIWVCGDCEEKHVVGSIEGIKKHTKTSGNKYFVMRHGEAENNSKSIIDTDVKSILGLTKKGQNQVLKSAKKLKRKSIDFIISSPLKRSKETAEIVAQVLEISKKGIIFDDAIREVYLGDIDGKSIQTYYDYIKNGKDKLTKRPPNGENIHDVKKRTGKFIYEIEKKYKDKNILLVMHDDSSWSLFSAAESLDDDQTLGSDGPNGEFIKNAEVRKLDFTPLPHNANYELDLHRPYIDDIELECKCGKSMHRVPEVLDVWFDSGAMPFAQDHYPFENKKLVRKGYPADFISEAIDQTRGWFYTLHAVGILMKGKRAFNNVISLGHIMDSKGKKMSKSIGNVIDPWVEIDRYGVDVLRMWMYSVNQAGESKNYDTRTVDEIEKKLFNILRNVIKFYTLYAADASGDYEAMQSPNSLDRWILSRLNELVLLTTNSLETYKVLEPARAIRDFVQDFSTWYVRRSRDRFKGTDEQDKQYALATMKHVLFEMAKLLAPFTPFISEDMYKKSGGKMESVHLEEWPKGGVVETDIINHMEEVRKVVSLALEARATSKIKVRQPLAKLTVRKPESAIKDDESLKALIADEVNVKEVVFENTTGWEVELDTNITPELKQEGRYREFVRHIQNLRKSLKLSPQDMVVLGVDSDKDGQELIKRFSEDLKKATKLKEIDIGAVADGEEVDVDGVSFSIVLKL